MLVISFDPLPHSDIITLALGDTSSGTLAVKVREPGTPPGSH